MTNPTPVGGTPMQSPRTEETLTFHDNSDVDGSKLAQHHTLGYGAFQAAAGNHNHDGANSAAIFSDTIDTFTTSPAPVGEFSVPDGAKYSGRSSNSIIAATSEYILHTTDTIDIRKNHTYLILVNIQVRFDTATSGESRIRYNEVLMTSANEVMPSSIAAPTVTSTQLDNVEYVNGSPFPTTSYHKVYTAPQAGKVRFILTVAPNSGQLSHRLGRVTVIDIGKMNATWYGGMWSFMQKLVANLAKMGSNFKVTGDYAP